MPVTKFASYKDGLRKLIGEPNPALREFLKNVEHTSSKALTEYHDIPSSAFFDNVALLGVFDETSNSISHSLLAKVRLETPDGTKEKIQATSACAVNILGKIVTVYVYKVYESPSDIQWTRQRVLDARKLLIDANSDKAAVPMEGTVEDAQALFHQGLKHLHGVDGPVDLQAAADLLRKAANGGHADAQYNLGMMYYKGHGVKSDDAEAFAWLNKAADQKHPLALCVLGLAYLTGDGVDRDLESAHDYLTQSAEQDYAEAQYNLGLMYAKGDGVAKNPDKAKKLLQRASSQGHQRATDLLNGRIR